MAVMLSKTYAAFKAAGAPDWIAREASEEIAGSENRLVWHRIRCEVAQVDGRNEHRADVRYLDSALHGVARIHPHLTGSASFHGPRAAGRGAQRSIRVTSWSSFTLRNNDLHGTRAVVCRVGLLRLPVHAHPHSSRCQRHSAPSTPPPRWFPTPTPS